jgi:hypothetical protein
MMNFLLRRENIWKVEIERLIIVKGKGRSHSIPEWDLRWEFKSGASASEHYSNLTMPINEDFLTPSGKKKYLLAFGNLM